MAAGEPRLRRRQCASMQCFYRLCDEDPGFRARNARLEDVTSRRIATGRMVERRVRVIPVVVHVVWNKTSENISMAQLRSQISVLNRDFRARNRDRSKVPDVWKPIVGDSKVEFELAKKDPAGKPTNGVVRVETDQTSFDSNDSVKFRGSGGSNAWPASRYLNLWVCTLRGGLLGYAQFPGGPKRTDGVVIRNTAFGTTGTAAAPFNKGRTATHEIGHFFNLRHIWGDTHDCNGSDFVADTPTQKMPNEGKPNFPHISCSNGPQGDMFMNYMDYVDDAVMFMFSQGQVARMEVALEWPRKSLGRPKPTARKKTRPRKKARRQRRAA